MNFDAEEALKALEALEDSRLDDDDLEFFAWLVEYTTVSARGFSLVGEDIDYDRLIAGVDLIHSVHLDGAPRSVEEYRQHRFEVQAYEAYNALVGARVSWLLNPPDHTDAATVRGNIFAYYANGEVCP